MDQEQREQAALMAYGLDSAAAEKVLEAYPSPQMERLCSDPTLSQKLPESTAKRLLHPKRPPIPQKIVEEVLVSSAFMCCICHQPGLPIAIHHLDPWEHSHSHDPENLAVLCLNHHGEAHTEHKNSRNLTAAVIRKARENWYETVRQKGAEAEQALENVLQYHGGGTI